MGAMLHCSPELNDPTFTDCLNAEDEVQYQVVPARQGPPLGSPKPSSQRLPTGEYATVTATVNNAPLVAGDALQTTNDVAQDVVEKTVEKAVIAQISDAQILRLAMALVNGLASVPDDRAASTVFLRNRLASASGQETPPENAKELRSRLNSLARAADRNLAEQLQLLVRFDDRKLYEQEGCRSMLVLMGIHLKLGRVSSLERSRVGRALADLPMLSSLFTLGHDSFTQLREVTRYATADTDAEFAIAVFELSVSETIEYCRRFRQLSDQSEEAANADTAGQEEADARAATRAYQRRSLSIREVDAHSTRVQLLSASLTYEL